MSSFEYGGEKFDLSSQTWRKRRCDLNHELELHELELTDKTHISLFSCAAEECAFCQADMTFDRNLEEILYHLQISKQANETYILSTYSTAFSTLIEKWKNGKDAWNNPIGENIKGE